MKPTLIILTVAMLVSGIAGAVWLRHHEREQTAQHQTAALQSHVRALESEAAQREVELARKKDMPPAPPLVRTQPNSNNPAPLPPSDAKIAMLQDPETRALMQKQQAQGIARMADKLISKDFARDWKLSPEQAAQAKELVGAKAGAGKDLMTAMLFDGLDDAALAQRGRELKERIEQSDAALRSLLGTDGFNALTEREHAQEDAGRLKRMREEFAATAEPLTQPQTDALLDAMSAERQSFTFRVNFNDLSKIDPEHVRDHFSEANLTSYFEDMQQLNARIVERAGLFLSPAQVQQFKASQTSQLEQSRLTVKMTTELFNKRRAN